MICGTMRFLAYLLLPLFFLMMLVDEVTLLRICALLYATKKRRHVQGSNLCGINPMDFKSIALTTRPTCLVLTCTLTFDDHGTLPRRHVLLINFDF